MENTSTEAMPVHYVTSIFSANTLSERQSFQCLLRGEVHVSVRLLHVGKEIENHLDYHVKFKN